MKVKIKATTTIGKYITEGKVYEAEEINNLTYKFKMDNGDVDIASAEHFTVIDEPVIEVGSEWVNEDGLSFKVIFTSDDAVFIKWEDGSHGIRHAKNFSDQYKQKPKTVTMYFYKMGNNLYASEINPSPYATVFTREIEL